MIADQRHEFASDNTATVCPEAVGALQAAQRVPAAAAYGEDEWTKRLHHRVCELFEQDCAVHLVLTGTAANALALAQFCQPFHSVFCHRFAHINSDECGACEFFTRGSKLIPLDGDNGKLGLQEIETAMDRERSHGVHAHKPRAISVTQATEFGTLYTTGELDEISNFARRHGLVLHMDGARFANAIASIRCSPAELSWRRGIDVLCFGGTKNGLVMGELVIFFDKAQGAEFEFRVKQAGQLEAKTRYFAASWLSLLENDVWLKNAEQANGSTQALAAALERSGAELVFPVQANAVFVRMRDEAVAKVQSRGWAFYKFVEPDIYRLMCSYATTDEAITAFVRDFGTANSCVPSVH